MDFQISTWHKQRTRAGPDRGLWTVSPDWLSTALSAQAQITPGGRGGSLADAGDITLLWAALPSVSITLLYFQSNANTGTNIWGFQMSDN